MQKLDVMIGKMRLLLADIAAREEQALTLRRQFSDQRERVLGHGIYGNFPLSHMLGMLADADERLADVERTLRHLRLLRERVQAELESLELTKGIEEAKSELARLEARRDTLERAGVSGALDAAQEIEAIQREIRRLQAAINEASERAARTLEARRAREEASGPGLR